MKILIKCSILRNNAQNIVVRLLVIVNKQTELYMIKSHVYTYIYICI